MSVEPDDINERWKQLERDWQRAKSSGVEFDGFARALELRIDWTRMVKTVRAVFGDAIIPAQRRILEHHGWNRFVAHRLRSDDANCQQEAWYNRHPPSRGEEPFVVRIDGRFALQFRPKPGG
jgi:hypothetical protein